MLALALALALVLDLALTLAVALVHVVAVALAPVHPLPPVIFDDPEDFLKREEPSCEDLSVSMLVDKLGKTERQ